MAVKMGLWSLTLLPDQPSAMYVPRDFIITNAALGEDLRDKNGRSVVKVTHSPIPPSLFDTDSEDEDSDDEESEEEFELDEEEGFKPTPKKEKAKANGDAEDEEEDDEEDEDEDDEEDDEEDSDYSDDGMEETTVLCSLVAGKIEQASLDLTFVEGETVIFEVTGENAVHLMGNWIIQPRNVGDDDSDYDSDEMYDGIDDYSDLMGDEFDDEELESDDEMLGKIEEINDTPASKKAIKKEAAPVATKAEAPVDKKRKAEAVESPAAEKASTEGLSKSQKKKQAKKAKLEAQTAAPAANGEKKAGDKKRTLPSGLIIEDVKVGDGPVAKTGKRLGMRYIGKLENGKQFDSNTAGKPFTFALGRGEVIKGWDQGLVGMAVGGERRLTIPAALAYGSQKLPGIPKNSTLKFDVKLVSVV